MHVVVVGGGVIGLAVAWSLARRGADVTCSSATAAAPGRRGATRAG